MKFATLMVVWLALVSGGCAGRTSTNPFRVVEPDAPLAGAARALPVGQAHDELTRIQSAGPNGEQAEYEWTILTRIAPAVVGTAPAAARPESWRGWKVTHLTLAVQFEKRFDDRTFDPEQGLVPRPGRRHVLLKVRCHTVRFLPDEIGGTRATEGEARPGAELNLDRSGWLGASLDGAYRLVPDIQDTLEVPAVPLRELVQPLFIEPRTMDLPARLDLLRVGDQLTRLQLAR